jgi:DNA-binding SARP family transcriptional activator
MGMLEADPAGATTPARLCLLGGFRLAHEGRPLHLGVSEQRLLAYLALHEPRPRSVVAGTLWPDATEAHAQGCLRTALWRVGRLRHGLVDACARQLRLGARVWVDVLELDRWISGWPAVVDVPLSTLRSGELLPDWGDQWLLLERERLRQIRLHALERAAAHLASRQEYAAALDLGLEAIRAEPLRETAHRTVITIHFAEGNVSEALRQYRMFRALLRTDLAATPSDGLHNLVRDELARAARRQ